MSNAKVREVIKDTKVWDLAATERLAQAVGQIMDGDESMTIDSLSQTLKGLGAANSTPQCLDAIEKLNKRGNEAAARVEGTFWRSLGLGVTFLALMFPAALVSREVLPMIMYTLAGASPLVGMALSQAREKRLPD